jgi:hypothetical protein
VGFFYLSSELRWMPYVPRTDKYRMITKCSSAHRCAYVESTRCARRYAHRTARNFETTSNGRNYTIAIAAEVNTKVEFAHWRVTAWNIIAYRRQICHRWNSISLRLWLCHDKTVHGVVSLGSVTESELLAAFEARWPTTLSRIKQEELRDIVLAIVHPGSLMTDDPNHRRYQSRHMTVRPRRARTSPKRPVLVYMPDPFDEPMPLLIG